MKQRNIIITMSTRERPDKERKKRDNAHANFAEGLIQSEEEDKEARKEILREGVDEREKIDKSTLSSSRAVTGQLSRIREEAGLSAFVGTSGKIKSPRFRKGEFISMLAREILLIGTEEMEESGGIISLAKIKQFFAESRENWELRENDIEEAIKLLEKQEMIPGGERVSDELTIVHFKASELSKDAKHILKAALGVEVTKSSLASILGWTPKRVDIGINQMIKDKIAIEDGENIYFPGL